MSDDSTLGGYLEIHSRPPAFEGSDGEAYSAAVFVDDQPDENGRFGAAVLFVRWSQSGDRPAASKQKTVLRRSTSSLLATTPIVSAGSDATRSSSCSVRAAWGSFSRRMILPFPDWLR